MSTTTPTRSTHTRSTAQHPLGLETMEPRCLLSVNPFVAPQPQVSLPLASSTPAAPFVFMGSVASAAVAAVPGSGGGIIDRPALTSPVNPNDLFDPRDIPTVNEDLQRGLDDLRAMETLIPEYDHTVDLLAGRDYAMEFFNRGVVYGSDYWGNGLGDYADHYGEGYAAANQGYNNALERREQQLLDQTGEEVDLNGDGVIGRNDANNTHDEYFGDDGDGGGFWGMVWDEVSGWFSDDDNDETSTEPSGITAESEGHMLTAFHQMHDAVLQPREPVQEMVSTILTREVVQVRPAVFATWFR